MTITFTCRGNSAPAYSCNLPGDQSGEYVSLEQYNALMAQNDRLRQELEYFIQRVEEGSIRSRVTYERFQRALASTPTDSLTEVRALAARNGFIAGADWGHAAERLDPGVMSAANHYSNCIRQGAKS